MKTMLLAMLLAMLMAAHAEQPKCRNAQDCGADECCVAQGLFGFRIGRCQKLSKEGEPCSDEEDAVNLLGDKYIHHCPCNGNLTCVPEVVKDIPIFGKIKIRERCISETSTTTSETTTKKEVSKTETEAPAED